MEKTEVSPLPQALPEALLPWYAQNRRELPWRKDRQPYHVWLSEIMLQQTRVEAVRGYYTRFLECLPTVEALAACDGETLQKLWEGLGYYSRMRNLQKAAQILTERYQGRFPEHYEEIRALPGVGDYTAGAICSICYNLPTPAVDGNVLRVVSRLRNDPTPIDTQKAKNEVTEALKAIYPKAAGDFTQALMELGATLCGPGRKPECGRCPVSSLCAGYQAGTAEQLPVKAPKKAKRQENKTVFILTCGEKTAYLRRPEEGLLAGLWEYPNVPGELQPQQAMDLLCSWGLTPVQLMKTLHRKHIFTHIVWNMLGVYVRVDAPGGEFTWLETPPALPTAFRVFREEENARDDL